MSRGAISSADNTVATGRIVSPYTPNLSRAYPGHFAHERSVIGAGNLLFRPDRIPLNDGDAGECRLVKGRIVIYLEIMTSALDIDGAVSSLAAAIGESTRARILVSLMDGCARTGTELVALAEVSPSTVSAHLHRLQAAHLVSVRRQGKNRYYSLSSGE